MSALASDPEGEPLAISTLRGQFADNAQWRADPARPAVVIGTVDMIGSRLLFGGYGCGFKSRPLHAGFLGQHTLMVHDEAHLEPAFQDLLLDIEREQRNGRSPDLLPLHVMELTATSRQQDSPFQLTPEERNPPAVSPNPPTEPIHDVWRRLKASKRIALHQVEDEKTLPDKIATLALEHKGSEDAVLVFVRKVEDVDKIVKKLPSGSTEQLTGTLRGLERDALVGTPVFQRFLPASNREPDAAAAPGAVFLVCTSAGEVGIDISADHMVCDLTPFDSMAQRFGRVNRFGDRNDTRIDIVHPAAFGKKDKIDEFDLRRAKTLELLRSLKGDGSPTAIAALDPMLRTAAFTPLPRILPATDILFDAWSMTTIRETLPGRPPLEPYLHGIDHSWEPPQTHVAWREEVQVITEALLGQYKCEDLLDDYPLKSHELLRDASYRVFQHLATLAERHPDKLAWLIDARGQIDVVPLGKLADKNRKERIDHATVLLPPDVGGLDKGRLDGKAVCNANGPYDVSDEWYADKARTVKRRLRNWDGSRPERMRLIRPPIDTCPEADELEAESVPSRRFWYWYERPLNADGD
ncbi:MAG: type I-U CRISPR-associated helicase/endonuclease Cas3, partial [Patescibacteria group bacterium]|nr:type I-U CRISPR-associated helicase/endonuclease Cas3 [Patescibacteria group bacterium]